MILVFTFRQVMMGKYLRLSAVISLLVIVLFLPLFFIIDHYKLSTYISYLLIGSLILFLVLIELKVEEYLKRKKSID